METKQVIVIRKDLNMRKGKMCAQAAHASFGIFHSIMTVASWGPKKSKWRDYSFKVVEDEAIEVWLCTGTKKIVVGVESEEELIKLYNKALEEDLLAYMVTDAGLTEFNGIPTKTCIAIGPAEEWEIDAITGHLKLL